MVADVSESPTSTRKMEPATSYEELFSLCHDLENQCLSLAPDPEAPITSYRHVARVWSLITLTCCADSNSSVKCSNSVVSLQDLCRARMATKTHPDKPEPIHVGQRIAGLSRESEVSNNSPSSRSSTSSW
jgi:hypothetical protein